MKLFMFFAAALAGLPAYAQHIEREAPPCSDQAIAAVKAGAEQKDPASLYLLGRHYSTGKCMAGDGDNAIQLYIQAAQAGYPPAFYNLGMIAAAQGDFKTAEDLFLSGASAGHRGCELQLGILYHFDIPDMHDDVKAYAWLSLSSLRTSEAQEPLERVRARISRKNRTAGEEMFAFLRSRFEGVPEFKFSH